MTARPVDLTPADSDEVIVAVLTAWGLVRGEVTTDGPRVWSRLQDRWVTVAEYATEWRHAYRYRAAMGDEETTRAVNRYEKGMGL